MIQVARPHLLTDLLAASKHTDKQTDHSYGPLYDRFLGPLRKLLGPRLLEIGVSMFGGGDLLAFAEYLPSGRIFGLDTDITALIAQVLFHPRIVLVRGDAYDANAPALFAGQRFEVIIDDCLHHPAHQVELMASFWPLVANGGQYIIEDLDPGYYELVAQAAAQIAPTIEVFNLSAERPACGDNILLRAIKGGSN